MKNKEKWVPSKYVFLKGEFAASRNEREVGVGSRLIADLFAKFFYKSLKKHAKGKLLDSLCVNVK
jgi:hypothetical protein